VIFVDANVPMYIVGAEHPHKLEAQRMLGALVREQRRLVSSSEVFQEIVHRFVAIDRRDMIEPAFETLDGIVDEVLAVERSDVFAAKDLIHAHPRLSARDALHVAVMRRHQIAEIVSFDRGFDAVSGIRRISGRPESGGAV
jgi:predicted nucleic acid-binding protein